MICMDCHSTDPRAWSDCACLAETKANWNLMFGQDGGRTYLREWPQCANYVELIKFRLQFSERTVIV